MPRIAAMLCYKFRASGAEANAYHRPATKMRAHAMSTTTTIAAAAVLCLLLLLLSSGHHRLAAAEKSFGGGGGGGYSGLDAGAEQQPQPETQPQPEAGGAVPGGGYSTPTTEPAPSTPAEPSPTTPAAAAAAAVAAETTTPTPTTPAAAATAATAGGYGGGSLDPDGDPETGLTPKAISEILSEHNLFRSKEPVPLPPLVWNATLAQFSQQYADTQLKGSCQQIHSSSPYGENLMEGTPGLTWKVTVDGWSEEKKNYHYETDTCDPGKMCGHYKAVVWKDTTSVGCGRIKCNSGDNIIMCSYWPPGNYDGVKPY